MSEQENLKIDISDSSSDRHDRIEMEWTSKNSELLHTFGERAHNASKAHGIKTKKWKKIYLCLGIPSVIIPVIAGILQPYLSKDYEVILVILMLLSGMLSACLTFINPSQKQERHDNASHKYDVLATNIETILAIPKRNRVQADLTINEYRLKLNHLGEISPSL